ncbi:MAG: hypothetical protein C0401_06105 [Anaerolinea sp.]|nr:hypothetical protein [Anaerolinea sp.]
MNFTISIDSLSFKRSCITIGTFDGVHLGHQFLIGQLVQKAHDSGCRAIVITFWPHPATFFNRAPLAHALTCPDEREELIKGLGVDEVLTFTFDQALADLEAAVFMQQLKDTFDVQRLFVGPNFALGKGRSGSIHLLEESGKKLGFEIERMKPFISNEGMISSSQIRADLSHNRVREASQKLGRLYAISGKVVHGEHRGGKLGVPTANLSLPPERLIPANGVYITRALVNGKAYSSVTNIGVRPTFENPLLVPRVEPHILDMQEHLYGQELTLEFMDFLRPEIKFNHPQELIAQIQKDIAKTREVFDNEI